MDLATANFGIVFGSWLYPGILCCGCILLFGDGHSLVVRHVGRIGCHHLPQTYLDICSMHTNCFIILNSHLVPVECV